jgi:hypothetical protein
MVPPAVSAWAARVLAAVEKRPDPDLFKSLNEFGVFDPSWMDAPARGPDPGAAAARLGPAALFDPPR